MNYEILRKGKELEKAICDTQVNLNLLKSMKEGGYSDFRILYLNKYDVTVSIKTNEEKELETKIIQLLEDNLREKLTRLKCKFENL